MASSKTVRVTGMIAIQLDLLKLFRILYLHRCQIGYQAFRSIRDFSPRIVHWSCVNRLVNLLVNRLIKRPMNRALPKRFQLLTEITDRLKIKIIRMIQCQ